MTDWAALPRVPGPVAGPRAARSPRKPEAGCRNIALNNKKRGKRRGEGAEGCGKGRDSREGCVKRVCAHLAAAAQGAAGGGVAKGGHQSRFRLRRDKGVLG